MSPVGWIALTIYVLGVPFLLGLITANKDSGREVAAWVPVAIVWPLYLASLLGVVVADGAVSRFGFHHEVVVDGTYAWRKGARFHRLLVVRLLDTYGIYVVRIPRDLPPPESTGSRLKPIRDED